MKVAGSLATIAAQKNQSLAESFLSADAIVIVDTSASMATADSRAGKSRYAVAVEELTRLQADLPGKVAVMSFANQVRFEPGGIPNLPDGSTDLAAALRFVQVADGCVQFFVVSDGEPNDGAAALAVAKQFESVINCVYVGPEGGPGSAFLAQLAKASGGKSATAAHGIALAGTVRQLLAANI